MFKRLFTPISFTVVLILCIHLCTLTVSAIQPGQPKINQDTLVNIIQQKDYFIRQNKLIRFIKNYVNASQPEKLVAVQDTFNQSFERNNLANRVAFSNFMKSLALNKQHQLKDAEAYMSKAISLAKKENQSNLLFQFYSHLGFIQTDRGNFIGAIYNYRLATKEVTKLRDKIKDNRPQAALNINISDLYYKTGFYAESLNYLDRAQELLKNDDVNRPQLISVIYYNKSENYFRMNNIDSLRAYHQRLNDPSNKNYKIYTYRQRTKYYLTLLTRNYQLAIKQIRALQQNKQYVPSELEDQRLADAYYLNGQLDSAKYLVDKLIALNPENNHPETKYHFYETLAWIAEGKGDFKTSSENFKEALNQSKENTIRLTQVGNISSQIKIDETENSYVQQTEEYERERIWLIFIVLIAALSLVAIALIYRNVKQKRHYEQLLYVAQKEEISFINSHEVRKHLTNILGIIDVLKHSENKIADYEQSEKYLLESASELDKAIKNISDKLND
jgi:tetratricopeptide (TPR) repeat protein